MRGGSNHIFIFITVLPYFIKILPPPARHHSRPSHLELELVPRVLGPQEDALQDGPHVRGQHLHRHAHYAHLEGGGGRLVGSVCDARVRACVCACVGKLGGWWLASWLVSWLIDGVPPDSLSQGL